MNCVDWSGMKEFTEWLSQKTGKNYRLPTEAEWEYAARKKGSSVVYHVYTWGDGWQNGQANCYQSGNCCDDQYEDTAPVGQFEASKTGLGIYDMEGNVWEWCQDWYTACYYWSSPVSNPQGPCDGQSPCSSECTYWQNVESCPEGGLPKNCNQRVLRGGSWSCCKDDLRISRRMSAGSDGNAERGGRVVMEAE